LPKIVEIFALVDKIQSVFPELQLAPGVEVAGEQKGSNQTADDDTQYHHTWLQQHLDVCAFAWMVFDGNTLFAVVDFVKVHCSMSYLATLELIVIEAILKALPSVPVQNSPNN
jgi:hypothetical protein